MAELNYGAPDNSEDTNPDTINYTAGTVQNAENTGENDNEVPDWIDDPCVRIWEEDSAKFPFNEKPSTEQLPRMEGMPMEAPDIEVGMHRNTRVFNTDGFSKKGDFTDWQGQPVITPEHLKTPIGYRHALYDVLAGNIVCDDPPTGWTPILWKRDSDSTDKTIDRWHPVSSLEKEYEIKKGKNPAWYPYILTIAEHHQVKIMNGYKFNNMAFYRFDGEKIKTFDWDMPNGKECMHLPFKFRIFTDCNEKRAQIGMSWLKQLTADDGEHSAQNLARMFADPGLRPYKQFTYIMHGGGQDGKGRLLDGIKATFGNLAGPLSIDRLIPKRGVNYSQEDEAADLENVAYAIVEESNKIGDDQLTELKRLSTGDTITGRLIRNSGKKFRPWATVIIATNNAVATTTTPASYRRFVFIKMSAKHEALNEKNKQFFDRFSDYIDAYGCSDFVMAGCRIWQEHGDEPFRDVVVSDPENLSDEETSLVELIVNYGFAPKSKWPRMNDSQMRDAKDVLGLEYKQRTFRKKRQGALVVKDQKRFAPYEQWARKLMAEKGTVPIPMPIEGGENIGLEDYGITGCEYWPFYSDNRHSKSPVTFMNGHGVSWKKDMDAHPDLYSRPPKGWKAWGIRPPADLICLDFDGDSFTQTQNMIGDYGSASFPHSLLIRSPHMGCHIWYRIPPEYAGKIKTMAHKSKQLTMDTRCHDGLAIANGSWIAAGKHWYVLCDTPLGNQIPYLSDALIEILKRFGYFKEDPNSHNTYGQQSNYQYSGKKYTGRPLPSGDSIPEPNLIQPEDIGFPMDPIPEHYRHDRLLPDTERFLFKYSERYWPVFYGWFMERATTKSGWSEQEAKSQWNSYVKYVRANKR